MFDETTKRAVARIARQIGVEPAALLAVAEVESGGQIFAKVAGRNEPLIRFEGHYFDKRLTGPKRASARAAGLSSPSAGAVANPASQAARWKLLKKAAAIDRQAAHESTSWGLGQVMGAHWAWLGFAGVDELVALCRRDAAGQIELMARYVDKAGLAPVLRARQWAKFARGYNGPAWRTNRYDVKMAAAFARHAARPGAGDGSVRELQQLLRAHGFDLAVDGVSGPLTVAALKTFQKQRGLEADGIAGPATLAALRKPPPKQAAYPPAGPVPAPNTPGGNGPAGLPAFLARLLAVLFAMLSGARR